MRCTLGGQTRARRRFSVSCLLTRCRLFPPSLLCRGRARHDGEQEVLGGDAQLLWYAARSGAPVRWPLPFLLAPSSSRHATPRPFPKASLRRTTACPSPRRLSPPLSRLWLPRGTRWPARLSLRRSVAGPEMRVLAAARPRLFARLPQCAAALCTRPPQPCARTRRMFSVPRLMVFPNCRPVAGAEQLGAGLCREGPGQARQVWPED